MPRAAGQSYRISLLAVVCVLVFEVGFHACVTVSCIAFRKADHKSARRITRCTILY